MNKFKLHSDYEPAGDQPAAIEALVEGIERGDRRQTLLGVTGSGKTFTAANVIERVNKPTLVVSQNKTLAAQLFSEFKHFFPENRVEFFVSYYDYYLPEAYIPTTDTYIAKDSAVNDEIEKYRLSATCSLLERSDVIVIASVSCIYGLGTPEDILDLTIDLENGMDLDRDDLLIKLVEIQYNRNDIAPGRSQFAVTGDTVDVYLSHRDEYLRIEFWGDEIENITLREPMTNKILEELDECKIFPATHYATANDKIDEIIRHVLQEMKVQVRAFEDEGKLVEAQRIYQRTVYDMEMLKELGFCSGIENYSRYLTKRQEGDRPYTLMDFFPDDFLLLVDESHVSMPQFRAMYNADRSRKMTLVDHGFRLPSALDNRPMNFDEFESKMGQTVFISATPTEYELDGQKPVELLVRPTGLLDPTIEIRPLETQIDDLLAEIRERTVRNERTIITCLTKKTSEDLTDYYRDLGVKLKYIHSDIDTIERIEILKSLRTGEIDAVVGINLLREGMDLPEVSLVAVLDADKEGFLRSETALTQIAGRAARNANGHTILYADKVTKSMKAFMDVTEARRQKQMSYNEAHGITPESVIRPLQLSLDQFKEEEEANPNNSEDLMVAEEEEEFGLSESTDEIIMRLNQDMLKAAEALEFERAAMLRDKLNKLRKAQK